MVALIGFDLDETQQRSQEIHEARLRLAEEKRRAELHQRNVKMLAEHLAELERHESK